MDQPLQACFASLIASVLCRATQQHCKHPAQHSQARQECLVKRAARTICSPTLKAQRQVTVQPRLRLSGPALIVGNNIWASDGVLLSQSQLCAPMLSGIDWGLALPASGTRSRLKLHFHGCTAQNEKTFKDGNAVTPTLMQAPFRCALLMA